MSVIRLDKYLADMQEGTRSAVKEMIRKGMVKVNGITAVKPDTKVNPGEDEVMLNEKPIEYVKFEYFMLNKPAGVLSASRDSGAVTVVDLIKDSRRGAIFPVGRLDRDSEGLMLITNDGALSHMLLSPGRHIPKTYYVRTDGFIADNTQDLFLKGFDINICKCDDSRVGEFPAQIYHTLPADIRIITSGEQSEATVTIYEGKFHQIKRMFMAVGSRVSYLKRISFGPLHLDYDLKPGEYRRLTRDEVEALKGIAADTAAAIEADTAADIAAAIAADTAAASVNVISAAVSAEGRLLEEMLEGIKGVIFDMDGTLLDSMDVWKQIDLEFLEARSLIPPEGMAHEIEGMSFHETAIYFKEKFGLLETLEEIEDIWHRAAYDKYARQVKLKTRARELLEELKARKIRLGIATSNSKELSYSCLEAHGIRQMFDSIVTGSDVSHGKPDPEIYLTAAENMGVFPSGCLVFEDVVMGIQAGISAGMRTCAVYDEFSAGYDEEKRKLADYYIYSFEELI